MQVNNKNHYSISINGITVYENLNKLQAIKIRTTLIEVGEKNVSIDTKLSFKDAFIIDNQ